jgi:hypothetical protein
MMAHAKDARMSDLPDSQNPKKEFN